jgi:hypothetical protein
MHGGLDLCAWQQLMPHQAVFLHACSAVSAFHQQQQPAQANPILLPLFLLPLSS